MEKVKNDAYRYAIKNAFEHNGKADIGAVIGKLKALHKEIDVKNLVPAAAEAVKKVNSMKFQEIENEFKKFQENYELKPKEGRVGLPPLEWAEKGEPIITRYAPNPNGPPHLGNARAAFLSYAYAKMYNGKFILRFEDTDPKVKKPMKNPEEEFRKDLEWFGIKIDEVYFASDRLQIYYNYMKKLIEMGKAYVCECKSKDWKKAIDEKKPCNCRNKPATFHAEKFEKMLKHEIKEGEALLRIKTDLNHPDPSVRDWWIARIVDKPEHPRATGKDFVWPSFMFQSAIDDHEMGITLILRGQEHAQNSTKQKYLYDYFGWKQPHAIHFGRISLGNMVLSTSKIKAGIEKGEYVGWDDIRLGTLRALKRRGFLPESLQKIIIDCGLTTSDAHISFSKMAAYNRELIKDDAEKSVFIEEGVQVEVPMMDSMEIKKDNSTIKLPRGIHKFIVPAKEIPLKKGEIVRLRNAYNIKIEKNDGYNVEAKFAGNEPKQKQIIPWIHEPIDLELVKEDGSRIVGAIESMKLEKGKRLYLEKTGYCIIDSIEGKRPIAYFTHE